MPAPMPTTRAIYISSGEVCMTLPNTTCSTCSGSRPARSMATRATAAPSSVGGTSRRLRPKEPIAVRAAEVITTLVTFFLWSYWWRASPCLDALDWAPGLDSQSHVEYHAAACHAPDGVEVRLDHLRDLSEQKGKAQHQLAQGRSIERSAAAEPVQLSRNALGGVDQLVGFCVGYRQQAERSRSTKTGPAIAKANPEHRAQIGIRDGPHQHIPAGWDHAPDDRSDPFPSRRVHASFELAPARSRRRLIVQRKHHSVDVARMRGSGKVRLQRHRSSDFRRHRNRALDIGTVMRGANRDPVRGQQRFRLPERKPAACGLAIKK